MIDNSRAEGGRIPFELQALVEMRRSIDEKRFSYWSLLAVFAEFGCRKAPAPSQGPLPVNVVTVVEKEVNEWDEFTGRLIQLNRSRFGRACLVILPRFILKRAQSLKKETPLRDRSASLSGGFRSRRRRA
jgi:hypothetical protein